MVERPGQVTHPKLPTPSSLFSAGYQGWDWILAARAFGEPSAGSLARYPTETGAPQGALRSCYYHA